MDLPHGSDSMLGFGSKGVTKVTVSAIVEISRNNTQNPLGRAKRQRKLVLTPCFHQLTCSFQPPIDCEQQQRLPNKRRQRQGGSTNGCWD